MKFISSGKLKSTPTPVELELVGVNKHCIACSVRCARGCRAEPFVSEVHAVSGFRLLTFWVGTIGRNEQCVSSSKVKPWDLHRPLLLLNTAAQTALPGL